MDQQHFNFEEEGQDSGGCRGMLGLCCWVLCSYLSLVVVIMMVRTVVEMVEMVVIMMMIDYSIRIIFEANKVVQDFNRLVYISLSYLIELCPNCPKTSKQIYFTPIALRDKY